ncbi:MAG: hypothetical protein O3C43_14760 [Verrucomicrobia bacterium]|nr:hypothetical protein [Verrucomicrobiota bacterium]MDA1067751.1 hypothetical protein [Verrucomicrobiota bacterium]
MAGSNSLRPSHPANPCYVFRVHYRKNGGHKFEVESISSEGLCATVRYIETQIPGGQHQALVDFEEHISIPILSQQFEYIDAVNQFDEPVSAIFHWQGRIFESMPCPIQYIVAPPSILLYESPGAQPLVNTSNRAEVTSENPAIAGFVLSEGSWVVIRGIGKSMNLESGYIEDPVITLHADQPLFDDFNDDLENSISNDNWQDTLRKDTLEYWKMAPKNENESALVTYLNPGPYSVHITANGEAGNGLVEVYIAPYALLPDE